MGGVNLWVGVGNLGRNAELRSTNGGEAVATFRIACSEVWYTNKHERKERTEWVNCVLWGKAAESLTPYLTKGKQVYVEGKLQTREWEGRDGQKRTSTEIRVHKVQLLGGRDDRERDDERDEEPASEPVGDFDDNGFDE